MKKNKFLLVVLVSIFFGTTLLAQTASNSDKLYLTTSGEVIFSFANLDVEGNSSGNVMRFSPWYSLQAVLNYDITSSFGLTSGLSIKNLGFIYNVPEEHVSVMNPDNSIADVKKKFRSYNLGIPLGFKIGKPNGVYFYGGYELEMQFAYKEKTYINESKSKKSAWFSDKTNPFVSSFYAGVQLPYGTNIKFKYYISEFMNSDYNQPVSATDLNYSDIKANIFYVSLCFNLFYNTKPYYKYDSYYYNEVD